MKNIKNIESILPMTSMQEGMLFQINYEPDKSLYFEQFSCRVNGKLEQKQFFAAWQHVLQRHPAMRSLFTWEGMEKPLQVIKKNVELPIETMDWQNRTSDEQERAWEDFKAKDRAKGFNLSDPPLMRVALVRISKEASLFCWSFHHMIMDGWCLGIVLTSVFDFYRRLIQGKEINVSADKTYNNYIAYAKSRDIKPAQNYWKAYLTDFAPQEQIGDILNAPTPLKDNSRHACSTRMNKKQTEKITKSVGALNVTLNTYTQLLWAILVQKYTLSEDIVFGTPVSGRPQEISGIEQAVGLFINTIPVRVKVDEDEVLAKALKRHQMKNRKSNAFDFLPLPEIKKQLQKGAQDKFFDTLHIYENYPMDLSTVLSGTKLHVDDIDIWEKTNYPLTLIITPHDNLSIRALYDNSKFSYKDIHCLLQHYANLLSDAADNLQNRIGALEILSHKEKEKNEEIKTLNRRNHDKINLQAGLKKGGEASRNLFAIHCAPLSPSSLDLEDTITNRQLKEKGFHGAIVLNETGAFSGYGMTGNVAVIKNGAVLRTGFTGRQFDDGSLHGLRVSSHVMPFNDSYIYVSSLENMLRQEPSVVDCAIIKKASAEGGADLIACIVTTERFSAKRYKDHLLQRLPEAICPAFFIHLSAIPVLKNGNVDYGMLKQMPVYDERWLDRVEQQAGQNNGKTNMALLLDNADDIPQVLHVEDVTTGLITVQNQKSDSTQETSQNRTQPYELKSAYASGGTLEIQPKAPDTLTKAFIATVEQHGNKGIHFINRAGKAHFQSYKELLTEALRVCAGLKDKGFKPGDRVVLQVQYLHEYFPTFWGCVLSGVVPVTVAVPQQYDKQNAVVKKLQNTWGLLGCPPVITNTRFMQSLDDVSKSISMEHLEIIELEKLFAFEPDTQYYESKPDDLLFIQLSSGSTGIPKCIQEKHTAVIRHIHHSTAHCGYSKEDVTVNWLPTDHVVPILTFHLKDVYLATTQVEIPTDIVLENPLVWLDALAQFKATHSWSPNFGFKLVSNALKQNPLKSWDLSSVKYLMNAGEQVTLPVTKEFLELTRRFGIDENVMQPAFGMAEVCTCMTYCNDFSVEKSVHHIKKASLNTQLERMEQSDIHTVDFIDLGPPSPGIEIRITDKENNTVNENVIGRFQIRGKTTTPGYLNNEKANKEAYIGDDWFNTGDIGFMHNGRLTLTGREKEIILIRGANFYCYEIEDAVNGSQGVVPTYSAAVGILNPVSGTEELGIFFSPTADELPLTEAAPSASSGEPFGHRCLWSTVDP